MILTKPDMSMSEIGKLHTKFLTISALLTFALMTFGFLRPVWHIFGLFTTVVHESGHAIAAFLSGSRNISISIDPVSTGGVTFSYGVPNAFIISSGFFTS